MSFHIAAFTKGGEQIASSSMKKPFNAENTVNGLDLISHSSWLLCGLTEKLKWTMWTATFVPCGNVVPFSVWCFSARLYCFRRPSVHIFLLTHFLVFFHLRDHLPSEGQFFHLCSCFHRSLCPFFPVFSGALIHKNVYYVSILNFKSKQV